MPPVEDDSSVADVWCQEAVLLCRLVKTHLPWIALLILGVLVSAEVGVPHLRGGGRGRAWKASRGDTRQLVEKILNNLKLPAQDSTSDVGVSQSEGRIEYWPFRPQDYTDPWAGFNYGLALKSGWKEEDILGCVQKLGRHRRVTFAGDSIMRAMYRQMLLERLGTDWPEMPSYWPLQQHDAVISVPKSEGPPGPDGPSPQASVTVSFRFLCNAHPHAEAVLQDVLDSDVLVLNSGLWDLSVPVSDVSFVRDYMYGLSHLVAFLRTNFDGRVIWRLNPTVFWEILDEGRKQVFQESKIRFINIFAEKLMRAAGYEIIDAFALSTGDPSIQGREDGYHIGHALTDALIDLTFNQICDPFGADFGPNTACEIIEAIVKDGQQNAPRWNGWGLDMSVDADQPQIQNLTMGHCKSASNRTK